MNSTTLINDSSPETVKFFAAPVTARNRISALDTLRGLCLLGILLGNIQAFASAAGILHDIPLDAIGQAGAGTWADRAMMMFDWLFMEGKMRAMFGMLFGAGTYLLLDRLTERSGAEKAADIFHRRSMWLVLFGLIHGLLIFNGDILLYYGSIALLALYPLRRVAARRLIPIGIVLSLVGGTWGIFSALGGPAALASANLQESAYTAQQAHQPLTTAEQQAVKEAIKTRRDEIAAIPAATAAGKGGYLHSEPDNLQGEIGFAEMIFTSPWIFEVTGIIIFGMGLFKTGFLSARLPSRTYLVTAVLGYAISFSVILIGFDHASRFAYSDAVSIKWIYLPYGIEQIAGMLATTSMVMLLVRSGKMRVVQTALAAVGRMALSNYILQSLICRFIFSWGPWQLYGNIAFHEQLYFCAAIWAFNIVASLIWLRFFQFGPLEWLWRSLTYWEKQPMRIRVTA